MRFLIHNGALTVLAALLLIVTPASADVASLLTAFDEHPTAENANRFFAELHTRELLDTPIKYPPQLPLTDSLQAQVWYWAGEWFYQEQDYPQAAKYAQKALPDCSNSIKPDCLNLLAITYVRLADYAKAARYASACYELDQATGDPSTISSSLNTLAGIYLAAHQPNEAEKYVLKGIELAREVGEERRLAILLGMASEIYHAKGDDKQALQYIDEAYDLDRKRGDQAKAVVRLTQKASVLIGLHNYGDAEELLTQAIPFLRQTGDKHSLGIACNKMGMTLAAQKRELEAIPYYREAADIFDHLNDPYNEVHARRGLYELLWKNEPEAAKVHLDRFNFLKDSIYNHVSAEQLARYNAEFGNDWLRLDNHAQRTAKWQAITLAVVIAVIALVVWFIMRRRNRQQAIINEKLSSDILMLNEQYRQLNIHYDNALQNNGSHDDSEDVTEADRQFVEKTVNVINQLISDGHCDANSVAAELGMSLFQFRQRLTKTTDETPQSFIQMIRMRRARHLLDHHPELNITEIAMLCAYNDTPNFTRAFKKTFGVTPTQYLEKQGNNPEKQD